jgi:hypothetical protein
MVETSFWSHARSMAVGNPFTLLAALLLGGFFIIAIVGPSIAPY